MKQIKRTTIIHLLLPAALLATLLLTPHQHAAAQGSTVLRIDPPSLTIPSDGTGVTEVQVADVSNFYGVEFTIEFNEEIVEVVDAEPDTTPGVQVGVGAVFTDQDPDYFVSRNYVYTDTGVIEFQATLRNPAPPFTGTGTMASITWRCVGEGESPVTLTMSALSDSNGDPITPTHTVEHGTIECGPPPNGVASGTVLLQGRDDHSDTYIFVTTEMTACVTAADTPIPGVPYAVTDAQGNFKITLYDPPDPYELPYVCLQAIQHGYLVGQYCLPEGESWGNLSTITLLGGDATEDDKINIFDLALIAARYESDDVTADVNGDDKVDIYDLVITAGNMGASGPVIWP